MVGVLVHCHAFLTFLHRVSVCIIRGCSPSKKGSTLKGENLLLQEQILSFKS